MTTALLPVVLMGGCDIYRIGKEAIITLQPSTGYIAVSCPWHAELNGCHWWAHRSDRSLADFLLVLDRSYVVAKLFKAEQVEEFDDERTVRDIKNWIIDQRRGGGMTAEKARDAWDEACGIETAEDVGRMDEVDDPWYFIRMRPKDCVAWFWNTVWASLMAHLREQGAKVAR